jgi:hypothetical protein
VDLVAASLYQPSLIVLRYTADLHDVKLHQLHFPYKTCCRLLLVNKICELLLTRLLINVTHIEKSLQVWMVICLLALDLQEEGEWIQTS